MLCGPHGAYSDCGWRGKSPDMEGTANITNKQSGTIDKGWPSSLRVRRVFTARYLKAPSMLDRALDLRDRTLEGHAE
jgi:hypothetical protein